MEEAIISRLLSDAGGVAALVSDRVFPVSRGQATALPAVTLQRVSGAPIYVDSGESGLAEARVQIDCWGENYASAKILARAVIDRLSAFSGTEGAYTFQNVLLDTEQDLREGGSNAAEYLFRIRLDFRVWYET